MPEKSSFMFHHTFYPKPIKYLEDGGISKHTHQKLQNLKQDYYNIVSKHRIDIGLTHLEEMTI